MNDEVKVILRPAVPGDKNFILSTWLKGQYYGNCYFRQVPQDLFFHEYAQFLSTILFTPGVDIHIACDQANPGWIVGFCVFKGSELYWIHVRRDYRERGIATLLTQNKSISTVKSSTKIGRAISDRKGLIFNPF